VTPVGETQHQAGVSPREIYEYRLGTPYHPRTVGAIGNRLMYHM
jgi:hypothetical protein